MAKQTLTEKIKKNPAPLDVNEAIFDSLCKALCAYLKENSACFKTETKPECIKKLQETLCKHLNEVCPKGEWKTDYVKPNNPPMYNDKTGIYGNLQKSHQWIIELDSTSDDQIAKKAFSQFALFGTGKNAKPFVYVAIVYLNSNDDEGEVIKCSRYAYDIAHQMNLHNEWHTIIIDCEHQCVKVANFTRVLLTENKRYSW